MSRSCVVLLNDFAMPLTHVLERYTAKWAERASLTCQQQQLFTLVIAEPTGVVDRNVRRWTGEKEERGRC
jgi:hypothetical protein